MKEIKRLTGVVDHNSPAVSVRQLSNVWADFMMDSSINSALYFLFFFLNLFDFLCYCPDTLTERSLNKLISEVNELRSKSSLKLKQLNYMRTVKSDDVEGTDMKSNNSEVSASLCSSSSSSSSSSSNGGSGSSSGSSGSSSSNGRSNNGISNDDSEFESVPMWGVDFEPQMIMLAEIISQVASEAASTDIDDVEMN